MERAIILYGYRVTMLRHVPDMATDMLGQSTAIIIDIALGAPFLARTVCQQRGKLIEEWEIAGYANGGVFRVIVEP